MKLPVAIVCLLLVFVPSGWTHKHVIFSVYREHPRGNFMIRYHKDNEVTTIPDPTLEVSENDEYHLTIGSAHQLVFRKDTSRLFDAFEITVNSFSRFICSYSDHADGVLFVYAINDGGQTATFRPGRDAVCTQNDIPIIADSPNHTRKQ